jgi:Ni/Co efflux regulator RcnB
MVGGVISMDRRKKVWGKGVEVVGMCAGRDLTKTSKSHSVQKNNPMPQRNKKKKMKRKKRRQREEKKEKRKEREKKKKYCKRKNKYLLVFHLEIKEGNS